MMGRKTREKPADGYVDQELTGLVDNSEFKRADVANPDFETPQRQPKRHIDDDDVYRDSAQYVGEEILVAEREQKVAARTHSSGHRRYSPTTVGTNAYDFGSPILLWGGDPQRARTVIRCIEGFMAVGSLSELSGGQGFVMADGAELETEVQGEVYIAISQAHEATAFTWWMERN